MGKENIQGYVVYIYISHVIIDLYICNIDPTYPPNYKDPKCNLQCFGDL